MTEPRTDSETMEVSWPSESMEAHQLQNHGHDIAKSLREQRQDSHRFTISYLLIAVFAGYIFTAMFIGYDAMPSASTPQESGLIVKKVVIPTLQTIASTTSAIFGPLLGFVLGYFFKGEK